MPRRFRDTKDPKAARADWKREKEASSTRRAPGGRAGGISSLMGRMRPGGAPGGGGPGGGLEGMMNHPAVGFGRQMTGGVGDAASAAIRNMVLQRLMSKGISQDGTGTWRIAGLQQPNDPGIAIRNSAIAAMDPSGVMLRRVLGAGMPGVANSSAMPGSIRGMPSGMGGVPSPGLGAGSLPISPQNGMPLPPVRPPMPAMPNPGGMQSVPPGLPGGPPMPSRQPTFPTIQNGGLTNPNVPGAGGPVPSPGLGGGFPTALPKPSGSFPPQGQGVGRTTTPTGAEIDPTKYPPTNGGGVNPAMVPGSGQASGAKLPITPGLGGGDMAGMPTFPKPTPAPVHSVPGAGGPLPSPGLGGGSMQPPKPMPIVTGSLPTMKPQQVMPTAGIAGGMNQMAPPKPTWEGVPQAPPPPPSGMPHGTWEGVPAQGSMPPPSVANDIYRQPGTPSPPIHDASAPWVVNNAPPPPPQGPPLKVTPIQGDGPPPNPSDWGSGPIVGYANPGAPLMQRLQQGRPGTPPAPGRAPTPMVTPGSIPGQSTPFNPSQMAQPAMKLPAIPRPTSFGTPGATAIPGQRQPLDGAQLAASIQQTVQGRIAASQAGQRPGVSPATPGSPVGNSLEDLGDRIRAAVAGNSGNVQPAAPGGGANNLGSMTQDIMARVRQQVSQVNAGMPTPGGTTPFPTPQNISMPTMPGGAPSTGGMPTAPGGAPVPPGGAPQAVPSAPSPGTTAGGLGSYGNPSVDQWDSAFLSAGQQYGVDPRVLKAMMEIESGGNGDMSMSQCRDDGSGVPSCGPMQIKGVYHGGDAADTPSQIAQAARILSDYKAANPGATDLDAITAVYFTANDPNGTTQGDYIARVNQLVGQMGSSAPSAAPPAGAPVDPSIPQGPGGTPLPGTTPGAPTQPVYVPTDAGLPAGQGSVEQKTTNLTQPPAPGADATAPVGPSNGSRIPIVSGTLAEQQATDGMGVMASPDSDETYLDTIAPGTQVSTDYKQPVTWEVPQLGDCPYCYQEGHGASGQVHAAMDIVAPGGYGAPMATPVSGKVICSGYGNGTSVPGWNCNYAIGPTFEDNNGPGQISLDIGKDAYGNQLIYNTIHMGGSVVQDGQMVNAGDQIGTQGSMGGMVHAHVETLAICNGTYVYLDPTLVVDGYYNSHNACG